jgi:hypothetical protein
MVVRVSFPYIDLPKRHEALIARKITLQLKEEQAQTATATADGNVRTMPAKREPEAKPQKRAVNDLPFLE